MASVRFTAVPSRPTACLDCTRVTLEAFPTLVPPFEAAFQALGPCGASMGNPGPPASFPCINPVLSRHRKIGCASFWFI
jgi:hypothetical protein